MSVRNEREEQWTLDNGVLARIGAVLYEIDTRLPITLPSSLAQEAVAAWTRDNPGTDTDLIETDAQRTVRHRAGTLALIGAAIEDRATARTSDTISVELDAWLIGLALETADNHGLISGPPPEPLNPVPQFITVDLDIHAAPGKSLHALVKALAPLGTIQNDHDETQGQFVSFALGTHHTTIGSNITAITAVINRLNPNARAEWDSAASRIFNVGIEAGCEPNQPIVILDPELIATTAAHDAGITLTHYPCHDRSTLFNHTTIT